MGGGDQITLDNNNLTTTQAEAFRGSAPVRGAIDALCEQLALAQSALTGARGPIDGAASENLASWLERAAKVRGKGGFFPYLGSSLGNGPLVELVDGSVKWDMIGGIGVHMFGHSDPEMIRASLESGLDDVVMDGNLQFNQPLVELCEQLVKEAGRNSKLAHCFLTNSGAMANESALKICQQHVGSPPRIIAFTDCFMGRSTTMAQIGDSAGARVGLPLNTLVDYVDFYDEAVGDASIEHSARQLEEHIRRYPGQHATFVMELVQGEGGLKQGPRAFFVRLMERCREAGIPIWADEVQSFGRTTEMFHFDVLELGDYVDVATVGKMSQGCAAIYTEEMNPKPGLLSGTFASSASACRVGLAALRRMREGGYYGPDGRNAKLQAAFRQHAEALVQRQPACFGEVRDLQGRTLPSLVAGTGGFCRFTPFGGERARVMRLLQVMFEEGVIAFVCGHDPYHIRMLPPVGVMDPDQFGPVFEIVERALLRTHEEG